MNNNKEEIKLSTSPLEKQGPRIILVHSFKGGTGKTLFASNLANQLCKNEKKVLLIESDFDMAAFQSIFTQNNPDIFFNDFLNAQDADLVKYIYPNYESPLGLIYCSREQFRSQDKIYSNDQNWFMAKKSQLSQAIKKLDYDYLIFDTRPGLHLFIVNIIALADDILLLLRPDRQSITGTMFLLDKVYSRSIKLMKNASLNLHLILNQVPKLDEMEELLKKWKNEFSVKYDFIRSIVTLNYQEETSYNTAKGWFLLPDSDPTSKEILGFAGKNF